MGADGGRGDRGAPTRSYHCARPGHDAQCDVTVGVLEEDDGLGVRHVLQTVVVDGQQHVAAPVGGGRAGGQPTVH